MVSIYRLLDLIASSSAVHWKTKDRARELLRELDPYGLWCILCRSSR